MRPRTGSVCLTELNNHVQSPPQFLKIENACRLAERQRIAQAGQDGLFISPANFPARLATTRREDCNGKGSMGWLKTVSNWLRGAETDPEESAPSLAERGRVLVIDDNVEFLNTLTETLRAEGFSVLRSNSGTKGLNMLRYAGGEVKVILLDFDMPHLDGAGTLKFIQQFAPQAKVIAVTGFDERFLPASFREGVAAIFHKPFDISKLITQLRALQEPTVTQQEVRS